MGDPLAILITCMNFLLPFLNVTMMSFEGAFFLCAGRLWNSVPEECFLLTYNLNGFKFSVNRHLFSLVLSKQLFYMLFIFIIFFLELHVL